MAIRGSSLWSPVFTEEFWRRLSHLYLGGSNPYLVSLHNNNHLLCNRYRLLIRVDSYRFANLMVATLDFLIESRNSHNASTQRTMIHSHRQERFCYSQSRWTSIRFGRTNWNQRSLFHLDQVASLRVSYLIWTSHTLIPFKVDYYQSRQCHTFNSYLSHIHNQIQTQNLSSLHTNPLSLIYHSPLARSLIASLLNLLILV